MSVKISENELLLIHDALVEFNRDLNDNDFEDDMLKDALASRDWEYIHHTSFKFLMARDALDLVHKLMHQNKKESEDIKNEREENESKNTRKDIN